MAFEKIARTLQGLKNRSLRERGNAIVMLFAAIGMAGVVTYGLNNVMRGPAVTTAELSRKTIAENNLIASSRLAIVGATRSQPNGGDCDRDGFVEALPFRNPGTDPAPAGGGLIPMTMGASMTDPWGNQYGYCVWDPGTLTVSDNVAGCGSSTANRLEGSPKETQTAIAIISAGKDGVFDTTCNAYVDTTPADGLPDTPLIGRPAGSDDLVISYTYQEANGIGGGEWKIDEADPTKATIDKDLDVEGGADFSGALNAAGGFLLPQSTGADDTTGPCDAAKDQQMRINTSTTPPSLEICNVAGTGWTTVSGGSGTGGVTDPSCAFPAPALAAELAGDPNGINLLAGNTLYAGQDAGGTSCQFSAMDVTQPQNPAFSQNFSNCSAASGPDGMAKSDTHMFIMSGSANRLSVWDITNSASPVYVGGVTDAVNLANGAGIAYYAPNYVVAASQNSDAVTVVNVSNPAAPVIVGTVANSTYLNEAGSVAVKGNYAYVTSYQSNSLTVIDLTSPATPAIVGHLVDGTNMQGPHHVAIKGDYAYVVSGLNYLPYIAVVDISNPTTPTLVRSVNDSAHKSQSYLGVKIYGKYMFFLGSNAIHIWDLSDPELPVFVRTIPQSFIGNVAQGLSIKDNYALVTVYDSNTPFNGLRVINLGCDPLTGEVDESLMQDPPPAPQTDRIDASLVGRWKMDEGTGTTANDSVGVNHGTFVITPTWGTGVHGAGSLNFNMEDRDAVQINSIFGGPHAGTVSMWVNARRADTGPGSYFFSLGDYIMLKANENEGIRLEAWQGSAYMVAETRKNILGSGWHYVTATWDDTNDNFRVYVDGVMRGDLYNNTTDIVFTGKSSNTYFGRWNTNANYDFDGGLDDVRLYNRALSPSEAAELYRRVRAESTIREEVGTTASNHYFKSKISGGAEHSCGIKQDQSLWCWGNDANGQLGNGPLVTATQASPYRVDRSFYESVSAGGFTTCAIRTDGTLWCWGRNLSGQVGIGVNGANVESPAVVGTDLWMQVSVGEVHTCGIKRDGTLWCWGAEQSGALGNGGNSANRPSPVQIGTDRWSYISAGYLSTCGIKDDGSLWCWGGDAGGKLGNGSATTADQTTPSRVAEYGPWVKVATAESGGHSTCAIKTNGSMWCWGNDAIGQLGNGTLDTADKDSPVPVSSYRRFTDVDVGEGSPCALAVDGSMWCWGSDWAGQMGNGTASAADNNVPGKVNGGMAWTAVATGKSHSCGIDTNGTLWCWGRDNYGQLGNGSVLTADQPSPTMAENWVQRAPFAWGGVNDVIMASAGANIALGLAIFSNASTGIDRGFGFTAPGKAIVIQDTDSNQLLLETATASAATQLTFRTETNTPATDVTTGLAAQWTLDEASGTTTTSSPGSLVGTLTNGAYFMPSYGINGGAVTFDGVDDHIVVPRSATIEPSAITIATWVYIDGSQGSNSKIISKAWNGHTGPTYNSYGIAMATTGTSFAFETGQGSTVDFLSSSGTLPLRTWIYVVVTFDPAGTGNNKNLYINGALNAAKNAGATAMTYDTSSSTGRLFFGQNGSNSEQFKGALDDVRIYNRALTAAEVTQLYAFQTSALQVPRTMGIDYSTGATGTFEIGRNNAAGTNWLDTIAPDIAILDSTSIGIGTATPGAMVDVNGGVKIGADYVCATSADQGKIRYVGTETPPWKYCNGSAWTAFPFAGSMPWKRTPVALSVNEQETCGIRADGYAYCWGANYDGAVGDNTNTMRNVPTMVHSSSSAAGWNDWTAISVQGHYSPDWGQSGSTCGLRTNGTVWCWGLADNGRLGNYETDPDRYRPVQVKDEPATGYWSDWVAITSGDTFHCGLRANSRAWCWGSRENGRLGTGATGGDQGAPDYVRTNTGGTTYWTDWLQIDSGNGATCGLRTNGTVWCWGEGDYGQLGNNDDTDPATLPEQVRDSAGTGYWSDWIKISKGYAHACGIRVDGSAWCWGSAFDGELGNNQAGGHAATPQRVRTSTNTTGWNDWIDISAGTSHTCGIRSDGSAWCWGEGEGIGYNSYSPSYVPARVKTSANGTGWNDWVTIKAGFLNTCGVRTNGTLWCWGDNWTGRLGMGVTDGADIMLPTQVP
jgi:alpha-tubulin suppressor-like RCC1 family protein